MSYDVVVIGARCAGAPTAMLLARNGHRVLLVDRSPLPSDVSLSTHLIHHAGTEQLASWGLFDALRVTGCPPLTTYRLDVGSVRLTGTPSDGSTAVDACAPRRAALDGMLVDAAVAAGVDVWDRTTVVDIVLTDDRVTGVRLRTPDGGTVVQDATLVVGADGRHSAVARIIGAPLLDYRPALQGTYFAYFADVAAEGVEVYLRPGRAIYAWPTNDGQTLVGVNWPTVDFSTVRSDPESHFCDSLQQFAPELAARVGGGERASRWIGTSDTATFRRQSHGPGWALVGDAAYSIDPCTAQGITDAFHDADSLAAAIHGGLDEGGCLAERLAEHERRRQVATKPMCDLTYQLSALRPLPGELQHLFAALADNQDHTDRFLGVLAGLVPVTAFFAPENIAIMTRA